MCFMKKMSQKQVWNEIALDWKDFRQKPRKEVEDFIVSCEGNLLDLGCGSGRHFVEKSGLKIYGTDFSEKMIAFAEKNVEKAKLHIELKKMEKEEIPFDSDFFDSVICIAVLHCVETKEKRKKLLQEIKRVLKPSGKALIQVWSKNHKRLKNKGKEVFVPWSVDGKKFERYYYVYDLGELKKEIKETGLRIISCSEQDNICVLVEKGE